MCILFLYRGEEDNLSNDYCLILATNRDEFYDRPAIQAAPWEEDSSIIGGRDMEVGKEGGSWLAASPERARVAVLLNLTGFARKDGKGRGDLVSNFVRGTQTSKEYFAELISSSDVYSFFNIITVEIGLNTSLVNLFSNYNNEIHTADEVSVAYGNSIKTSPLKKVQEGYKRFTNIVSEFGQKSTQDQLVDGLLDLLKWEDKHYPDDELDLRSPKWSKSLCSVYVRMPAERYGSRTHTIILVDKEGNFEFIEKTMKQPVDPMCPEWLSTHLTRKLGN